ncbi:MAG: DUF4136 domain-containing protein [Gemmatimonadetes bacterium]|nr:DUF4136 domain-containing protein [Gemmatimonadota bacterium]
MKNAWFGLKVGMAGVLLGLTACHPGEVSSISQLDLVVTLHDEMTDFTTLQTYFLLDSVVHIDLEENINDSLLNRDNDAAMLALIRTNIENMGYTETTTNPDAIFMVGAVAQENFAYYANWPWYPYWGYYPGWGCCSPGWGWGYPGYGYGGGVSSVAYATGSLMILMADPVNTNDAEQHVPLFWMAVINGLLEGTAVTGRTETLINQSFSQSPYLRTN